MTAPGLAQAKADPAAQRVVRFSGSAHAYISPQWEAALKLLKIERDRVVPQLSQPPPGAAPSLPAAPSPSMPALCPADTSGSQGHRPPPSPYDPGSPEGSQVPPAALDPRMQKLPGRLGPGRLGNQLAQQPQQGQHAQHAATAQLSQPYQQPPQAQQGSYRAQQQQQQQQQAHQAAQRMQQAQQQLTQPPLGNAALGHRAATIDLTEAVGSPGAAAATSHAGAGSDTVQEVADTCRASWI